MNIKVYLDSDDSRIKEYVDDTIDRMNAHQDKFRLIDRCDAIDNQRIRECIQDSTGSANKISYTRVEVRLKQIVGNDKCVIITDKPFLDNYFSHTTSKYQFISVSDWDELYAPPHMGKFFQYEIIQFLAICAANLSDTQVEQKYYNHSAITADCLFDFCARKTDIHISLRSGRICSDCKRNLSEFDVTEEQFQALDILLKLMTGKATFERVFIVHGHGYYKETIARYLESLGVTPVILSEQASRGMTIIDKFEKEASKADFAIVLYTPDDIGGIISSPFETLQPRARQNVVFEHGYFTAKLGRENVVVMLKNDTEKLKLETAGDNDGVIYIPFDDHGGWREQIKQALRLSGYRVNQ